MVDGAKLIYSIPIYIARSEGEATDEMIDLVTQLMEFGASLRAYGEWQKDCLSPDLLWIPIWMPEDDVTK